MFSVNTWMKVVNKYYPLLWWATTFYLIGPVVLISWDMLIYKHNFFTDLSNAGLLVLGTTVGFLYSLPILGLAYLLFLFLVRYELSSLLIKIILDIFSIGFILLYFDLLRYSIANSLGGVFSLSVIISSFFYRVYEKPEIESGAISNSFGFHSTVSKFKILFRFWK